MNGIRIEICPTDPPSQAGVLVISPDLTTGGFLLAAVDPAAENHLVHLDQSVTTGRMLAEQDTIHPDTRFPPDFADSSHFPEAIPMLIHQNLPGQIGLSMQLIQLVVGSLPDDQLAKLNDPDYVAQLPSRHTLLNVPVPLVQNDPARFANSYLGWDGQSWQPYTPTPLPTTNPHESDDPCACAVATS